MIRPNSTRARSKLRSRGTGQACEFGKYTDDTVASLAEAYEQALSLWNNTTFSSEQNGLVSNAATLLNTALDGLKLRETKPDDQPGGGEAKPNDKQPSKDKNASKADGKPTADLPRTGSDIVPIMRSCFSLQEPEPLPDTLIRRKHV